MLTKRLWLTRSKNDTTVFEDTFHRVPLDVLENVLDAFPRVAQGRVVCGGKHNGISFFLLFDLSTLS